MPNPHEIIAVSPNTYGDDVIRLLISEAAYYKAEKRGFSPGQEDEDWLQAEKEIKSGLNGHFNFLFNN